MNDLFGKFGPVRKFPFENRKGKYAWRITAYLDESFSFLIKKLDKIPTWISIDKELFMSFLAGLIDSDGTITLKGKDRPCIRIISTSEWLIGELSKILRKFNYHVVVYKKEKHDKTHFGKKPVYELEISKKKEVKQLLLQIPFRHEEKGKRASLALKLRKELLTKEWKEFLDKIKSQRIKYQKLAERKKSEVLK
jgi:hypothetical protein